MTPQQLLETLASTRFGGRQHVLLERSGGVAVAVQIEPHEARAAWLEARALLDTTGRWPVAMTTWPLGRPDSWLREVSALLDTGGYAHVDRPSVGAILEQAEIIEVDAALAALEDRGWRERVEEVAPGEVDRAVAVMNEWLEPMRTQPTAMVFLPTARTVATVAYEPWYAEDSGMPAAALVALLARWNAEYVAEVMAHWGTMLQLRVERPPTDIDRARALAREQLLVAPCTTLLPGTHPEAHARALLQAKTWFLHERP